MPKPGEVVSYRVHGKEFDAIVFDVHINQRLYVGRNGEPLVAVTYYDKDAQPIYGRLRAEDRLKTVYDVTHVSARDAGQGQWYEGHTKISYEQYEKDAKAAYAPGSVGDFYANNTPYPEEPAVAPGSSGPAMPEAPKSSLGS